MIGKLSEHQIQDSIMRYLRYRGYYVERMNAGKMRYKNAYGRTGFVQLHEAGTPDLLAHKKLADGSISLVRIEVKAPGNKPTRLQTMKMEELEKYGALCLVAYSIEDVQKYIK